MKFTLRQLEGFAAAARGGSFTRAAMLVSMTQPAFSQLIRELEGILGARLFDRTTRKISLTEPGRQFLRMIARPIEDLEQAYAEVREISVGKRGRLLIGTLPSFAFGGLAETLAQFKTRNPAVAIRLIENGNPEIVDSVKNGEVDFGIGVLIAPDNKLTFRKLLQDELVVVCPTGHDLAKRKRVSWSDIAKHTLILLYEQSSSRVVIDQAFAISGISVEPAIEVANMVTSMSMVRAGLGVTVMPRIALSPLRLQGLEIRPIRDPRPWRQIGIMARADRQLAPAAAAFIEMLITNLCMPNILSRKTLTPRSRK
jgi:DNA-binding transcriptional LysR family regulator